MEAPVGGGNNTAGGRAAAAQSLAEVLHFLQREWNSFARQRVQWIHEKQLLEVRKERQETRKRTSEA